MEELDKNLVELILNDSLMHYSSYSQQIINYKTVCSRWNELINLLNIIDITIKQLDNYEKTILFFDVIKMSDWVTVNYMIDKYSNNIKFDIKNSEYSEYSRWKPPIQNQIINLVSTFAKSQNIDSNHWNTVTNDLLNNTGISAIEKNDFQYDKIFNNFDCYQLVVDYYLVPYNLYVKCINQLMNYEIISPILCIKDFIEAEYYIHYCIWALAFFEPDEEVIKYFDKISIVTICKIVSNLKICDSVKILVVLYLRNKYDELNSADDDYNDLFDEEYQTDDTKNELILDTIKKLI